MAWHQVGKVFLAIGMCFSCSVASAAPSAPTSLQIDCTTPAGTFATNPTNCSTITPTFKWTGSGYNAWQIKVDSSSDFNEGNSGSCPWIWDSGTIGGTDTSVQLPSSHLGACAGQSKTVSNQGPWPGLRQFYWKIRLSADGGSTWSPYSAVQTFSYNVVPRAPANLSFGAGDGSGAKLAYGDTSIGNQIYVATTGANSATCGAVATPCRDIAYAVNSRATNAGDQVIVRGGTYAENICVSSGNGTRSRPKWIRNFPGETPIISGTGAACGGETTALGLGRSFWVVEGLTFRQSGNTLSIHFNADDLMVRGCVFDGSNGYSPGNTGEMIQIGGRNQSFISNTAHPTGSCPRQSVIYSYSGNDMVIRGNEMTGPLARGYDAGGSQGGSGTLTLAENYIHDLTCQYGLGISLYYGVGDFFVARNHVEKIDGQIGIRWDRGDWGVIRNNLWGPSGFCYSINDPDGNTIIENDICRANAGAWGIDTTETEWLANHRVKFRNSNYFGFGDITDPNNGCGINGSLCIDVASSVSTTNPNLDSTGKPTASSAALLDLGNTPLPVPVGGGSRGDIGRFEFGAAPISQTGSYDYQPLFTASSTTPKLSWTFVDSNNDQLGASQVQSAYQVQIDTVNTFDSVGPWKPLCDSGKVASANSFYNIPASCGLVAGNKYYFRVRVWDNLNTTDPGIWSDYANAFSITSNDNLAPQAPRNLILH